MSKKMSKIASWFKRQWKAIILILVGIALLVSNICVLLYVSDINSQSAWLRNEWEEMKLKEVLLSRQCSREYCHM